MIGKLTMSGSHHHRNSPTRSDRRVRFHQRHRLVWQRFPPHFLLLHDIPRSHLHFLLSEVRLPVAHRCLRDWISGMWLCTKLHGFHHRASHLGRGCRWTDEWRYGAHDQRDPTGEKASVGGRCWRYHGYCECCWAVAWWGLHDERELEMVLLQ